MIAMKASEIAQIVDGELHGENVEVTAPAFLNSAECISGSIFLAIKGERVDGFDFISDAFDHGAVIAMTTKPSSHTCIVVDDVTRALTALASHIRTRLTAIKVVGITGSQGKTTTKELLAAILSTEGATIAPKGNHNNELGVPLTLLQCTESTQFCVVEMGARHEGDIAALVKIARPDIGVVLRVAAAHIGEFGSLEAIARAKSEMVHDLTDSGIAILGQYDPYTPAMKNLHAGRVITFGETSEADVRATDIEVREGRPYFELVTPEGRATVALRLFGLHQISNALAAAAVGHALGLTTESIAGALSMAESKARWRMEVKNLEDLTLINDAYNASPDSMAAALTTLAHLSQELGGESWAFLGNMRELGDSSAQAHAQIATLASQLGIDHLVTIDAPDYVRGLPQDSSTVLHQCSDRAGALELVSFINRGDVILCKASRSDRLEEVAAGIEELWIGKLEEENREEGKQST
jgi:UDP-N-acetylmuramoyl-tripeptide--D-alanyl-D-alanine ligase